MKRIVIRASKRDLFKRFPNKKFPTNRLMYQLYKEYFDQVWPSSAKNFRETLHSRAKPTKEVCEKSWYENANFCKSRFFGRDYA